MDLFAAPDSSTGRFQARKAQIKTRTVTAATGLWDRLVDGPSDAAAAEWVSAWAPTRRAGATVTVALTDAWIDGWLDEHQITPAADGPLDADTIVGQVRTGVSDVDLAMRPIKQVRRALAGGATLTAALAQGRQRLTSIETTDIQQAFRLAFQQRAAAEPAIGGYRRVLYGPENCALCVIASTRRYHTDRLMPIHPGCDCGVLPIAGSGGQTIDRQRLDEVEQLLKREGVSYGDRAQLANTKIRINVSDVDDVTEVPHGELGPLLAVAKHRHVALPAA